MKKTILSFLYLAVFATLPSLSWSQEIIDCNNVGKEQTLVELNNIISCSFEQEEDTDVFVLSSKDVNGILLKLSPPNGSCVDISGFNPQFEVFDSSNKLIATERVSYSGDQCVVRALNFSTRENEVYSIVVSGRNRQAPSPYELEFQCISGSCISSTLVQAKQCASEFDGQQLNIPFVTVGDSSFWARLNLISSSPLEFRLNDFGPNK
jgi:hypothetical protein